MCFESPETRARRRQAFKTYLESNSCIKLLVLINSFTLIVAALVGVIAGSWLQHYFVGDQPIHAIWVSIYLIMPALLGILSMVLKHYYLFQAHYIVLITFIYPLVLQLTSSLKIYNDCDQYCPGQSRALSLTCIILSPVYMVITVIALSYFIAVACSMYKSNSMQCSGQGECHTNEMADPKYPDKV